jgi:hypothetical protein
LLPWEPFVAFVPAVPDVPWVPPEVPEVVDPPVLVEPPLEVMPPDPLPPEFRTALDAADRTLAGSRAPHAVPTTPTSRMAAIALGVRIWLLRLIR